MIKVGITGGIGSGKSIICKVLETLDYPVYYADDKAKFLTNTNDEIISSLKNKFGDEIYSANNLINRKKLAELIFINPENLKFVNQLIHPIVINDFLKWSSQQNSDIVFQEAALIIEAKVYEKLDYTISIISPKELRIERVMKRDKISKNEIIKRIENQVDDDTRIKFSDFIIYNDDKQLILSQILEIIKQINVNRVINKK
jgi:dephospho-CoA kinase